MTRTRAAPVTFCLASREVRESRSFDALVKQSSPDDHMTTRDLIRLTTLSACAG